MIIFKSINNLNDSIKYYKKIINSKEAIIILDFSSAGFIRNNYLSIIGLALEMKIKENKQIQIIEPIKPKVKESLENIGFLSQFTNNIVGTDIHNTMVGYKNIDLNDWDGLYEFYTYFEQQLNKNVNNLSSELSNKIIQKIFELFSNVFRHSKSKLGFFCSGQFYPDNHKFYFTIVDGGVTIKNNVNEYLKSIFDDNKGLKNILKKYEEKNGIETIKWALIGNHSTTGEGGLGLSLLKELIEKSKGTLEIISNDGYYSIKDGVESEEVIKSNFNGTIISIGLNTNESTYYYLKDGE
ncbi:MAG: hypothetical protein QM490_04545 [Candidatus Gracilibacteria bacterium]